MGLLFHYEEFESSLLLPAEVFSNSTDHRVVSLVYKTLNAVMRLKHDTNTTQNCQTIQYDYNHQCCPSNTLFKTRGQSQNCGKEYRGTVVEPVPPRTCVYWREGLPSTWKSDGCRLVPSESNKHVTTCECDHLTVFAALMDPYGRLIPKEHRKSLELISTIGCGISLFAVLLTIGVTWFFWRTLKSPRTIVLMNICVALAVVCLLVIVEGAARDTKVGCTVVAALLHYFLLAVFCWMLCEGVLLYLIIVKIIGAEVEEKVKFFWLFGWAQGYGYYGDQTACWLAVDNGLIWAFIAPAIVILLVRIPYKFLTPVSLESISVFEFISSFEFISVALNSYLYSPPLSTLFIELNHFQINITVFVLVIRQMMGTRIMQKKPRDEQLRIGVKATAVILPLLGITWAFGLLAFNSATLAFKYIFAILNSCQGLMIFIFHCVLNNQVNSPFARYLTFTLLL
ncbi:hypothetical protein QZH41_012772 [Actinostola sp. cb2023]|nr:hypothetical protein QZH41_012772 [Actinostola sp. cb2023]